jgi:hypothetical protein
MITASQCSPDATLLAEFTDDVSRQKGCEVPRQSDNVSWQAGRRTNHKDSTQGGPLRLGEKEIHDLVLPLINPTEIKRGSGRQTAAGRITA